LKFPDYEPVILADTQFLDDPGILR